MLPRRIDYCFIFIQALRMAPLGRMHTDHNMHAGSWCFVHLLFRACGQPSSARHAQVSMLTPDVCSSLALAPSSAVLWRCPGSSPGDRTQQHVTMYPSLTSISNEASIFLAQSYRLRLLCCRTISFYPQLLANFRRKSVEGLSLDFILMNIAGFTCYTVYNLALFTSPTVQAEYKQRFQTTSIPVELNDVLFGIHALLLSVVMAIQCMIYPKSSMQKVSLGTSLGLSVTGVLGLAYVGVLAVRGESDVPWTWLDLCYYCSFVKMGVTLVK